MLNFRFWPKVVIVARDCYGGKRSLAVRRESIRCSAQFGRTAQTDVVTRQHPVAAREHYGSATASER